ncbi:MAG: GNAT family protein [Acetobacteraceae bacterium]
MEARPLGPPVDATPRPLPARTTIRGQYAILEPLHRRHTAELWQAAQAPGAAASWDYLGYGPFSTAEAMATFVADFATNHDPMAWAVRPVATGVVTGWLTLMDIQPRNAAIELGHIWFGPAMQRTRAATEAMVLLLRLAADELGYRRLVWKCNALNAPSRRAAARLGFVEEGTLRAHLIVKRRVRDTAYFSILAEEWPSRRDALLAWLDPENFAPDGTARRSVAEIREAQGAALHPEGDARPLHP